MKKIKFDIIMPVYNAEDYLLKSLEYISELDQSSFEIYFIDDGSVDNSNKILAAYCKIHPNAQLIYSEHRGVSAARNIGLENIRGDYVLFLDADDRLYQCAFSVLQDCISETPTDIIIFGAKVVNYSSKYTLSDIIPRNIIYNGFSPQVLFCEKGSRPYVWNCAYKASFLKGIGIKFQEDVTLGEDHLFQFSIFPQASNFRFISDKLYQYNYLKYESTVNVIKDDIFYRSNQHIKLVDKAIDALEKTKYYLESKKLLSLWIYDFLKADILHLKGNQFKRTSSYIRGILKKHDMRILQMPIGLKKKLGYWSLISPWGNLIRKMIFH